MAIEWDFQEALYTVLNADGPISAAVTGVYDIAPQSSDGGDLSAFPYITIGTTIISEDDTGNTQGHNVSVSIHTWSHTGSMRECKIIQGLIYGALHDNELTIIGFNNYSFLRETTDVSSEQDGAIHGVCIYRALIESA